MRKDVEMLQKTEVCFQHFPTLCFFTSFNNVRLEDVMEAAFRRKGAADLGLQNSTNRTPAAGWQCPRGFAVDFDRSIQDDKRWLGVAAQRRMPFFLVLQIVWCGLVQKNRRLLLAFHNGRL